MPVDLLWTFLFRSCVRLGSTDNHGPVVIEEHGVAEIGSAGAVPGVTAPHESLPPDAVIAGFGAITALVYEHIVRRGCGLCAAEEAKKSGPAKWTQWWI